jgi:hypothetical protein
MYKHNIFEDLYLCCIFYFQNLYHDEFFNFMFTFLIIVVYINISSYK